MSKRKQDENQKQYHERLKNEKIEQKQHKRGRLLWDSKNQGTYIREKHGELV